VIHPDLLACAADWARLPGELRRDVRTTYDAGAVVAHAFAVATAVDWYAEHPAGPAT